MSPIKFIDKESGRVIGSEITGERPNAGEIVSVRPLYQNDPMFRARVEEVEVQYVVDGCGKCCGSNVTVFLGPAL